jgi:hypothetical protein
MTNLLLPLTHKHVVIFMNKIPYGVFCLQKKEDFSAYMVACISCFIMMETSSSKPILGFQPIFW